MHSDPTVSIIDDDPAARLALTKLVESMDLRTEAFASAQEFLDSFDRSRPGCVLLDMRMPGICGLELLERLVKERIFPPVILISAYGDVPTVVRAMKAGALNFLEKPCREQHLWEAIQEALRWDADRREQIARTARIQRRIAQLTPGERDVLEMLVEGKSNKAMATQLGLSVRTIEVRRAKVMQKMEAESLAQLVRLTLAAGNRFEKPPTPFGSLP